MIVISLFIIIVGLGFSTMGNSKRDYKTLLGAVLYIIGGNKYVFYLFDIDVILLNALLLANRNHLILSRNNIPILTKPTSPYLQKHLFRRHLLHNLILICTIYLPIFVQ